MEWIPQNDLMGHPNTKLFLTHGGETHFTIIYILRDQSRLFSKENTYLGFFDNKNEKDSYIIQVFYLS